MTLCNQGPIDSFKAEGPMQLINYYHEVHIIKKTTTIIPQNSGKIPDFATKIITLSAQKNSEYLRQMTRIFYYLD